MKIDNTALIAAMDAKTAAEKFPDIKDRLRAAMKAVKDHWCCTDEAQQFVAAVGAVMELSDTQTKETLKREMDFINAMAAGRLDLADFQEFEPIGILPMWREVLGITQ